MWPDGSRTLVARLMISRPRLTCWFVSSQSRVRTKGASDVSASTDWPLTRTQFLCSSACETRRTERIWRVSGPYGRFSEPTTVRESDGDGESRAMTR